MCGIEASYITKHPGISSDINTCTGSPPYDHNNTIDFVHCNKTEHCNKTVHSNKTVHCHKTVATLLYTYALHIVI